MSQFECSVNELNGEKKGSAQGSSGSSQGSSGSAQGSSESAQGSSGSPKGSFVIEKNSTESPDTTIKTDVTKTILDKLTEERNIKIILLIVIGYLITTSLPFLELLMKMIPYVMTSATETNIVGKIISAVLIGIAVVFFTSFFQGQ